MECRGRVRVKGERGDRRQGLRVRLGSQGSASPPWFARQPLRSRRRSRLLQPLGQKKVCESALVRKATPPLTPAEPALATSWAKKKPPQKIGRSVATEDGRGADGGWRGCGLRPAARARRRGESVELIEQARAALRCLAVQCTKSRVVCVECLIGKQKKPILFKVTEPSSIPYRTPPACAKMASYSDPPPVILLPESDVAQAAYAETLLPGSAQARNVSRYWGSPQACYRIPCCD